jgi:DNA-binding transcriptional regulator YhcF (GntR family)
LQSHDKIPSVRELAISLSVNSNTVVRGYTWLEEANVISMQRGLGYFVTDDSVKRILDLKKQTFFQEDLPKIFHQMDLLHINMHQISQIYKARKNK